MSLQPSLARMTASDPDFPTTVDVAIVGFGPVGQALALSLGAAGHRVACFERFHEIYRLPRAVHLDTRSCACSTGWESRSSWSRR